MARIQRKTKWLAREACCPHGTVVGPSGETQDERPSGDAGEKMGLHKRLDVVGADFLDAAPIDNSGWNSSSCNEPFEPVGGIVVVLIVVGS
jgi:hypothetical protein